MAASASLAVRLLIAAVSAHHAVLPPDHRAHDPDIGSSTTIPISISTSTVRPFFGLRQSPASTSFPYRSATAQPYAASGRCPVNHTPVLRTRRSQGQVFS